MTPNNPSPPRKVCQICKRKVSIYRRSDERKLWRFSFHDDENQRSCPNGGQIIPEYMLNRDEAE